MCTGPYGQAHGMALPDFTLGMSPFIIELTAKDPYILKERTELYKINIEQDTAIQKLLNLQRNAWIAGHFRTSKGPYECFAS